MNRFLPRARVGGRAVPSRGDGLREAIRQIVGGLRERVLEDLMQAIRFRTENPPGSEGPLAEFLASRLREMGAAVSFQELAPGRLNVVGIIDFGGAGDGSVPQRASLTLTSHMDVVAAKGGLERDLFTPTLEQDLLYGRGAVDAKGPLIAMLNACAAVVTAVRNGYSLHGRLVFAGVADEESGGHGTRLLVEKGPLTQYAIVGEPTELQVVLGHRGSYRRKVTFWGKAAHSSDPSRGVNAIYRAARFALEVEQWNGRLQGKRDLLFGSACVSANVIEGGSKVTVIPDRCSVQLDRRLLPGETTEAAHSELLEILERLRKNDPTLEFELEDLGMDKQPAVVHRDAPVVKALEAAVQDVTGQAPVLAGYPAGTDMTFLAAAGVQTAIFGPGSLAQAHTANEFVRVEDLWAAVEVYALTAARLLGCRAEAESPQGPRHSDR